MTHNDELGRADQDSAAGVQLAVDIGTRYIKIAYSGPDGVARLLPATAGGKPGLAPLCFYLPKGASTPLVGEDALRLLGRGELIDFRKLTGTIVRLHDRITTPGALYSELFRYLRSRARATVGDVASDAPLLISVPTQLDQDSRNVLAQAAREAGFAGADFIDLPVSVATAWASAATGTVSRGRILLVDIGARAVSLTLLDNQGDGSFRIDWSIPPGELKDCGAEDVELDLLEHLSASLAPPAAQALKATREVAQDELRRAKEQIAAGATAVSMLVDGHDICVDERMIAKAASNLLDTVATFVGNQLAEFKNTDQRKPMVLLAGGGARTPGLAARLAALKVSVTTWDGQATGGATGALLLAHRPVWVELNKQERAARRRRAKRLLAGAACLLVMFLSCVAFGWLVDEKGHTAALAAMQDRAIPPAQAIATVEEYLTENFFRKAVERLTAPFADLEGRRTQARKELANYAAGLANRGAAGVAALEREFRWPPDSQSPTKLRAIMDGMRVLIPLAPQAQSVSEHASLLADLADAALVAAAAQAQATAAVPSDTDLNRMDTADLKKLGIPINKLVERAAELTPLLGRLAEVPNSGGYQAFLADMEQTRHQLESLIQGRNAAIVCSDAQAELEDPGSRSDYAHIGADLAKLPADLCGGQVASLQHIFVAHERIRAELDQLRRDAIPLIEARRMPELRLLLSQRWRAETFRGLQRWFGVWLNENFAHAEDAALQQAPERIHNTAERDQIEQTLLRFSDAEAGFSVLPYNRPTSITQRIHALQAEITRVIKVLNQGATIRRIEFFPTASDVTHSIVDFRCDGSALNPAGRRIMTITEVRSQRAIVLQTETVWNRTPYGFFCSGGTHASWETTEIFATREYRFELPGIFRWSQSLGKSFELSPDNIVWISDGGAVDLALGDNYVLRLIGSFE